MKTAKQILLIAFLLLQSIPALAANWELVGESTGSDQYYIETESIRRVGNKVQCWETHNYNEPQFEQNPLNHYNNKYSSAVHFVEYDCFSKTFMSLQIVEYSDKDRNGSVIYSKEFPPTTSSRVIPGTVSEMLMMFACKLSRKK